VAQALITTLIDRLRASQVTDAETVYAINGRPSDLIVRKNIDHLTPLAIEFIAASPYFMVATADGEGNCDVSPKGDPPGVVRVLDERTLAIPDRLGNRRVDGHRNIVTNGHVGLLFMIPGVDETLRVNGRCFLTTDAEFLATMSLQGRPPKLAMVVEIDEVFMHCARSYLRSGLWKPETWPDPDTVPTLNAILCEQLAEPAPDESAGKRNESYRSVLY